VVHLGTTGSGAEGVEDLCTVVIVEMRVDRGICPGLDEGVIGERGEQFAKELGAHASLPFHLGFRPRELGTEAREKEVTARSRARRAPSVRRISSATARDLLGNVLDEREQFVKELGAKELDFGPRGLGVEAHRGWDVIIWDLLWNALHWSLLLR